MDWIGLDLIGIGYHQVFGGIEHLTVLKILLSLEAHLHSNIVDIFSKDSVKSSLAIIFQKIKMQIYVKRGLR